MTSDLDQPTAPPARYLVGNAKSILGDGSTVSVSVLCRIIEAGNTTTVQMVQLKMMEWFRKVGSTISLGDFITSEVLNELTRYLNPQVGVGGSADLMETAVISPPLSGVYNRSRLITGLLATGEIIEVELGVSSGNPTVRIPTSYQLSQVAKLLKTLTGNQLFNLEYLINSELANVGSTNFVVHSIRRL